MKLPYESPTLTYLGQLGPNGELPASAQPQTYEIGDFVWVRNDPDGSGPRWLGHVESGHSVRSQAGHRWRVRVRRRHFWTSGSMFMYVDRKLRASELADNRRLGLIPAEGAPL